MSKMKNSTKELIKHNIPLTLMALPAMIMLFLLNYLPLYGVTLAFKDFSYPLGIWNSPWIGLENFEYVFTSGDIWRTLGNTVLYHLAFTTTITGTGLVLAILLFYIKGRKLQDTFQSAIVIPYLVSYTVIAYIVYILLSSEYGLVNTMLANMGAEEISWYTEPKYWPFIIVIVNVWFGAGIKSVYYFSALLAIDDSLFEAADLDGAKRHHHIFNIMMPSIAPTVCIFLILDLGNILQTNFALFYSVPMDSSALYSVTDVLSTYTYRGLINSDIGTTTALGLFTGIVTSVMTLSVNGIVKKVNPDNALL